MNINSLVLSNFRNYEHEEFEFSPYTNIIYGNNAQGKTNLLEAAAMFSHGRSSRTKSDKELVRKGADFAGLDIKFESTVREHSAKMRILSSGKKQIKVNDVPIAKLSMLMNYLNTVMFSPDDLDLVKGSPSNRRRFLDLAISQMMPRYLTVLIEYSKTLAQKNSLLKKLRSEGKFTDSMLSVWNSGLCESGAKIMKYRKDFIADMNVFSSQIHSQISREKLNISYMPSMDFTECDEKTACECMMNKLEENQRREIENGASLYGVHRDDMKIEIDGNDARLFASQGQKRTAVLSIIIAQTEYIYSIKEEYPILLLDDIMSELDKSRRMFLSQKIKDKQVLITCTDADLVDTSDNVKLFEIKDGRINRK